MSKKNLLSGRDKELQEMAEQYEAAKAEIYEELDKEYVLSLIHI